MRGMTIVVAAADPDRFRTALTMALSQNALGGRARIFLQERAVALLSPRPDSDRGTDGSVPDISDMLADALTAGVEIIGCQTGLALIGNTASDFDARIEWGGMIHLLQSLADDRLIAL